MGKFFWICFCTGLTFMYVVFPVGMYLHLNSEGYAQLLEERKKVKLINKTDDGCGVYSFYTGSTAHYFTRCETSTVTTRNYTEQVGKRQEHRTEEISTENN